MAKLSFANLQWAEKPTATRFEIEDDALPAPLEIWLRRLSAIEEDAASELAERLTRKYVTGNWTDDLGQYAKDPLTAVVDGRIVPLNARTLWIMARIELMQDPPAKEDVYRVDNDLITLAALAEGAWNKLVALSGRVMGGDGAPKAAAE